MIASLLTSHHLVGAFPCPSIGLCNIVDCILLRTVRVNDLLQPYLSLLHLTIPDCLLLSLSLSLFLSLARPLC